MRSDRSRLHPPTVACVGKFYVKCVAPGPAPPIQITACCALPLGASWEAVGFATHFAQPVQVGKSILPPDIGYGVIKPIRRWLVAAPDSTWREHTSLDCLEELSVGDGYLLMA